MGCILDRRLPAIVAIALVASTVASFLLFHRAPEERVTVIRNAAPERLRRQLDLELTHNFVLGLVARERSQQLEIIYSFLLPADPLPPPPDLSTEGWKSLLPGYDTQSHLAELLGFEPEMIQGELARDGDQLPYAFFDLGDALSALTDPKLSEDATAVDLLIARDDLTEHWAGKDGLYYHRSQISRVVISRDDQEHVYVARRSAQELEPDESPIEDAPWNGRITFVDIRPDESFSVILELDGRADQPHGSLSLIRIYMDGELIQVLANFIA